mmetsp:Transcript_7958/g.26227  ORF Transcript_7958/g.26227 Transcript_7958/m.26227 type:complete len:130 (+) Transcript_7958:35-424(+)|eukprot:CAMPEP_0196678718 /NCGR_PEP_ID=MMETSP1090-20130531/6524_1 /TAXON_ID=37098 /ORGANISM="Isochrysis sp, Strain CCMP1244" /LENGTH=129 /DNA_ID=CAMNT_0042016875 /DNA_START=30 /DNA_END=419 /DNA_ORIENTATION=-
MRPAQSDLVNILSSLEAHWHVLEAEVVEIGSDIEHCKLCSKKYGDWFDSPLQFLQELQRTKKEKMKEILVAMESFNNNLQGGRKLVRTLERTAPVAVLHAPAKPVTLLRDSRGRERRAAAGRGCAFTFR